MYKLHKVVYGFDRQIAMDHAIRIHKAIAILDVKVNIKLM